MRLTKVLLIGVFDLLHQGHLNLINKAARLGLLTVGIVSDDAVRLQKGADRPIQSELFRQELVGNLRGVFNTFIVDGFYFPANQIADHDLIMVGEDQQHFSNIKEIPFEKYYILPRTPDVSTSNIVKKLKG